MDIRCPSCNTLYEFNEARLKPKGVNLKCSQCGHVFRVEGRKQKASPRNNKRWMVRKVADGEVLYFQGLSTLQKWIIDRKVGRLDQISRSGASWKNLADISELSSFFQVAESIERLQQAQGPNSSGSGLAATTTTASVDTPVPDYFDPLAPGESSQDDDSAAPISLVPPVSSPEPAVTVNDSLKPPDKPLGASPRDYTHKVSYQESDEQYSPVPLIVAVLILLLLVVGIYIYLKKPEYLGMPPKDKPPVASTDQGKPDQTQTLAQVDAGTPSEPKLGEPRLGEPRLGEPKLGEPKLGEPDAGASAPASDKPDAGQDKAADADAGMVNLNANAGQTPKQEDPRPGEPDAGASAPASDKPQSNAPDAGQDKAVASQTGDTPKAGAEPDKVEDKKPPVANLAQNKAGQDKAGDKNKPVTNNRPVNNNKPTGNTRAIEGGLMKQGLQALREGDGKGALDAFERAANDNPGSAAAWRGKGWAYLQLNVPSAAVQNFEKALAINPRYGDALIGLARAYRQNGQTAQAISTYQKYLSYYPSGPQASAARAQLERMGAPVP